jgi:predicted DNA-binding transcriptional regulator
MSENVSTQVQPSEKKIYSVLLTYNLNIRIKLLHRNMTVLQLVTQTFKQTLHVWKKNITGALTLYLRMSDVSTV